MNNSTGLKILLIDDEPSVLHMLSQLLSLKGHLVDTSPNGEEGLEKIKSNAYDVVITDIQMPGLTGTELATIVKSAEDTPPPIIGLSGTPWLLDGDVFDACLSKPCCKKDLYDAVEKVVVSSL